MTVRTCPQCHQDWETPFCPMCGVRLDMVLVPCPNCQAMVPPTRHCQECGWKLAEEALGTIAVRCNDGLMHESVEIVGPRRDRRTKGFMWIGTSGGFGGIPDVGWFAAKFENIPVGQWTIKVGPYRKTVDLYTDQWEEVDFLDDELPESGEDDDDDY